MGAALGAVTIANAARWYLNFVSTILLIPLASWLYVQLAFPAIPQSLGGGRPIEVELLVSAEALPDSPEFRDWRPGTEKEQAGQSPVRKPAVLVPVTLYFHTEHELYVRKGSGPILSLSDHAIEGILYNSTSRAR